MSPSLLKQLEYIDSDDEITQEPWETIPTIHGPKLWLPTGCGFDYPIKSTTGDPIFSEDRDKLIRDDILIFSLDVMIVRSILGTNNRDDMLSEYRGCMSGSRRQTLPVILLLVNVRKFLGYGNPSTDLDQIASAFEEATPSGRKVHVLRWSRGLP